MSKRLFDKLGLGGADLARPDPEFSTVGTAKKDVQLKIIGRLKTPLKMKISDSDTTLDIQPTIVDSLSMDLNLSGPWMKKYEISQLYGENAIRLGNQVFPLIASMSCQQVPPEQLEATAYLTNGCTLEPMTERVISVVVPDVSKGHLNAGDFTLIGSLQLMEDYDVNVVRQALVSIDQEGRGYTRILNSSARPIFVPAGQPYGKVRVASATNAIGLRDEILAMPPRKRARREIEPTTRGIARHHRTI